MRKTLMIAGVATMLAIAGGKAEAAPFIVAGTATGSFNGASPTDVATLGPLTFNGNEAFSFEAVHDEVLGTYSSGVGHFGTFTLGLDPFSYSHQTFALTLSFTSPVGTNPNPSVLSTTLRGGVHEYAYGLVSIEWDSPATLTYDGGVFDLVLDNLTWLKPGMQLEQTGTIRATVPEPMSFMLVGSALGFAHLSRRFHRRS